MFYKQIKFILSYAYTKIKKTLSSLCYELFFPIKFTYSQLKNNLEQKACSALNETKMISSLNLPEPNYLLLRRNKNCSLTVTLFSGTFYLPVLLIFPYTYLSIKPITGHRF